MREIETCHVLLHYTPTIRHSQVHQLSSKGESWNLDYTKCKPINSFITWHTQQDTWKKLTGGMYVQCRWPLHCISCLLLSPMMPCGMEAEEDHVQERRGASWEASAPNQIPRPMCCFAVLWWPLAGFTIKHDVWWQRDVRFAMLPSALHRPPLRASRTWEASASLIKPGRM